MKSEPPASRKRKLACTRLSEPGTQQAGEARPLSESDLYLPVKRFLESQGYEVKGEVGDCDVAAVRGDEELVVVELKLSLNLELVLQAVDRLVVTSKVYVGVPVGNHNLRRRRRQTVKLLRMLGLGLLVFDPDVERHGVDVVLDPGDGENCYSANSLGGLATQTSAGHPSGTAS